MGFISCAQDDDFEKVTAPTTRSVPSGAFTDLERFEGNLQNQISANVTCAETTSITFTITLHYPSSSRYSAYFSLGAGGANLNQSAIKDVTVTLAKGTSRVGVTLKQGGTSSFGGYARMSIKEVNSGTVIGYTEGYEDLVVEM